MRRALCLALAVLALAGCRPDDGLKPDERQMADRLDAITKKSGGDWVRLTDDDRRYLVQDVSRGSEPSAKLLLQARAGRLKGTPGGRPR